MRQVAVAWITISCRRRTTSGVGLPTELKLNSRVDRSGAGDEDVLPRVGVRCCRREVKPVESTTAQTPVAFGSRDSGLLHPKTKSVLSLDVEQNWISRGRGERESSVLQFF